MTTEWRIQWGRSIEGPDGGIDRCAPMDHHGGVATGVEGVNTSVLPLPPFPRAHARVRERRVRGKSARFSRIARIMDFVFVRKHASKYGLTVLMRAPRARREWFRDARMLYSSGVQTSRRERETRRFRCGFLPRSRGVIFPLQFVGNILFKYLSLVGKLWYIERDIYFKESRRVRTM